MGGISFFLNLDLHKNLDLSCSMSIVLFELKSDGLLDFLLRFLNIMGFSPVLEA